MNHARNVPKMSQEMKSLLEVRVDAARLAVRSVSKTYLWKAGCRGAPVTLMSCCITETPGACDI